MENKHDEFLADVINKNGQEQQLDMVIEECLELATAVVKYKRFFKNKKITKDQVNELSEHLIDILEEVADVEIMCRQCRLMFGSELVDNNINHKINRLKSIMI